MRQLRARYQGHHLRGDLRQRFWKPVQPDQHLSRTFDRIGRSHVAIRVRFGPDCDASTRGPGNFPRLEAEFNLVRELQASAAASVLRTFSLLHWWEKVARTLSAPDEGSLSEETDPSPVSNSLRSFEPPSPTRG